MHVLAEHRELLGQIAVQLGQVLKARRIDDLPFAPLLKRCVPPPHKPTFR